jgi:hypothetical protein
MNWKRAPMAIEAAKVNPITWHRLAAAPERTQIAAQA